MNAVNIDAEQQTRIGVPSDCVIGLYTALKRVFDDGETAIANNHRTNGAASAFLDKCNKCVLTKTDDSLHVISGDDWEFRNNHNNLDKSVDIIIAVQENEVRYLVSVEGKLGLAFDTPRDKAGGSLSCIGLENKYNGCLTLIAGRESVAGKMIVLVPSAGQEFVWYLIRRWNVQLAGRLKLFSCCVHDFLVLFGLWNGSKPEECQMNTYRTELLRSEFYRAGAMSHVQLPKYDCCISCGKCRDRCRDVVRRSAIAMVLDPDHDDGILRPFVDVQSCKLGCRECEKACPILHPNIGG